MDHTRRTTGMRLSPLTALQRLGRGFLSRKRVSHYMLYMNLFQVAHTMSTLG